MFWGNPNADSGSDGKAVFNETNGYARVWHLGKQVSDEVGTLTIKSTGVRSVAGVIGDANALRPGCAFEVEIGVVGEGAGSVVGYEAKTLFG
jgi:hypothetical protein